MTPDQFIPNNLPSIEDGGATRNRRPRIVSDAHQQMLPDAAPLSPCSSQGSATSSSPAPATICITGAFNNIEYKYYVDSSRILGSGHHGSVRECIDRVTGRRCAVKSIRKNDPEVRPAGIAREITLLREMKHGNIVTLIDVYEDFEYVHLVTDMCDGGELFDKIVERSANGDDSACFGEDEAARIVYQILTALSYMHERNIAHRDIKPENILFETANDFDSPVKIIDFGLSRKHREDREAAMSTLVGTPYYIAPEVLRKRYGKSCDLWSVGVIAYILLCGYPPFNGADNEQTHRCVLKGRYYFHEEDWENISGDAMDFIHELLQMDPRHRMTAEEALAHPWISKYRCSDVVVDVEEERQDKSSVEVVYDDTPRKQLPVQYGGTILRSPPRKVRMSMSPLYDTSRKQLPTPCGDSPHRLTRKVRMSMFVY
eukprot:CAMPEP_0196141856 /NCGR_PEP_ID=MMETSP0910-20130528/10678_1 /TAXON_ID=49265 /ORGANISM="Thalassiosira rotula, Strain GSO102" /LENGTH=428 /DNA_ID=CAMNT_0041403085 /DNA_START=35 /DNA_END=1321 /DNA_ORIENTATION=-